MRYCLLGWATLMSAQGPVFRTTVPEVHVPVTVTRPDGKFGEGLKAGDFSLFDNGVVQKIRLLAAGEASSPVALVVAVQLNDIANSALLKIRKTGSLIEPLLLGERGHAAVITFSDKVTVEQQFTSNETAITGAFRRLTPDDSRDAHLVDAVDEAARLLSARPAGERKAIIVIGESRDRGSKTPLADVIVNLQRGGITVFTAVFSAYATAFTTKASEYMPASTGADYIGAIKEIARLGKVKTGDVFPAETGGRKLSFNTLHGLEGLLIHVGEEIHSQYLLTYTPEAPTAGYHTIEVRLPGNPKAQIHARPGYWIGEVQ
jgi:VWFA-related protein